jgi:hypothetical protein
MYNQQPEQPNPNADRIDSYWGKEIPQWKLDIMEENDG